MKIKAFGMDIQVTEESVFVNGKEVYNKIDQAEQRMNVIDTPTIEVVDGKLKVVNQKYMSEDELIELSEAIQKEQRMNVIGQNGNDGLHYGFWEDMNNDLMDNNRNEGIWDTDN